MRIAVIHDWLATNTGAERVLEQILHCLPDADLFTICDFLPVAERGFLGDRPVRTSFIQRLPFARSKFRHYLPLMPLAIEQFDLSSYDLIVSSSWAVAKGVITGPDQLHISYVHTPIRYAWEMQHQYLSGEGAGGKLKSMLIRQMLHKLRMWDFAATSRVDVLVANSHYVSRRIEKCYRRKSQVIYPPVDVGRFELCPQKEDFYFSASRMVPYKKVDLLVKAFSRMPRRRLVVIGDGPEMPKIKALAGPNVELLGYKSADVLKDYMQRAKAFVFAAEEDFGITPVEAQACGTPVIAYGRGGATESVLAGETGLHFSEQTPGDLVEAVNRFEQRCESFDPHRVRAQAEQFSVETFRERFQDLVDRSWTKFTHRRKGHVRRTERAAAVPHNSR